MERDEEDLVRRACGGDQDALAELLVRHGPAVRQSLSVPERWRSLLDLDEVMQGAYYNAFVGIESFRPRGEGSFRSWLGVLARNRLRDELKKLAAQKRGGELQRVQPRAGDDSLFALYQRVASTGPTPSVSAARAEVGAAVRHAIGALPEPQREIVRLRDLEGLTFDVIAGRLGKSATAVRMLHRDACERLRTILETASRFLSGPGG